MIRLALVAALLAACGDASPPGESNGPAPLDSAQAGQVLEIDYDAGRVVIDDESRGITSLSIDHERGILYVRDYEEPEGVLAFSLDTGERLRTYRVPTGDGPRELPEGIFEMSAASNGRLYVSDMIRVIEFGPLGEYVSTWAPNVPPSRGAVCDFDGQPAVPTLDGVIRRGEDGVGEGIGPNVVVGNDLGERTEDELRAAAERLFWTRGMVCTADAAFIVMTYADESDSVTVYDRSNEEGRLRMPTALARDQAKTVGPRVTTDGRGNIVLLSVATVVLVRDGGFTVMGAVVDPGTGCHATIRNPERDMFERSFRGIYRDSAVVAVIYFEEGIEDGRRAVTYFDHANKVALHPLRRVSGEPCPGMLPSVGSSPATSPPPATS